MSQDTRRRFLGRTLQVGAGLWAAHRTGFARANGPGLRRRRVIDIQKQRILEVADGPGDLPVRTEVAIFGAGLGGVAAAIAACDAGRSVCLFEETDWLGGQATSQGVSALDDNGYIEISGATRTYMQLRREIRDWYRTHARVKPEAAANPRFNPGRGWGMLGFEPHVGVQVLDALLAEHVELRRLRIFRRCKAYAVVMDGDSVRCVDAVDLDEGRRFRVEAKMFIDATELGDLLALGAAEFVVGAEAQAETGEAHAAPRADPEDVQSFTYSFFLEHCPGKSFTIEKPSGYARNRDEQPFTFLIDYGKGRVVTYRMFEKSPGAPGSFWTYRRTIDASQFEDPGYAHDIALINWSGNDYRGGSILVDDPDEQIAQLRAARDLSLGFAYWLQTEAPRDDGGRGYPEFKLRADLTGTPNGLVKFPYIRESRRIRAIKTILEEEVTSVGRPGPRAVHYTDSVGIGFYGLDLHESKRRRTLLFDPSKPFQVPLGALVPRRTSNLLAGGKNIGTTHITNGCYRLHPVEWAIGEAAGAAAALCVERGVTPREARERQPMLRELQERLVRRGAPIMWYDDVGPADARFPAAQLLPFEKPEVLGKLNANLHAPS